MAQLPSGTVTFLFTDIEGSTRRWERGSAVMRAVVERHFDLLRAAIEANDGVLFKIVGDAVQAAFPTASDALHAAVAAQRAVAAEDWGDLGPLLVRMAIHSGAAAPENGDYLAPVLNRLARLLGSGHGGQILLSQAAQQLARDNLPPDVRLLDLGEHRLRDLVEPDQVYQVVAPGLPDRFPPLKSQDQTDARLPIQFTRFIGREREAAAARRLLTQDDVRLLTLTGPGGAGKTRLALRVASDLADRYPDGVWFVPLAPVADPDLVPAAVAKALNVREAAGQPIDVLLREFLREKRLLLLLDNFEHVVDASPWCAALLADCPAIDLLVTSRTPLRVSGEHELAVPPLELPPSGDTQSLDDLLASEAVQLFVDRARAVRPDFALNPSNAAAVVEICRRLDGLPLAIELAAARVKLLPPQALLARLDNRLALLTGGERDRPERQQTLRATIAWSYDLLDQADRDLFALLAVFVGGWTLDAAEAVVSAVDGVELEVFDRLASLIDMSLVRPADDEAGCAPLSPRFGMLQTINEFAAERLAASGWDGAARAAHAGYFESLVAQNEPLLTGPQAVAAMDLLERDHDNLRAALLWLRDRGDGRRAVAFAAALWRFWWVRGYITEGRALLESALAAGRGDDARTERARALDAAGVLAEVQGDYDRSESLHAEALAISRSLGDDTGIGRALGNLGVVALDRGDDARATALLEEGLAHARAGGDPATIATILNDLAWAADGQGDDDRAEALHRESLALRRRVGDASDIARSLNNLGAIALDRGDCPRAEALFAESLALYESTGDRWGKAGALNSLGEAERAAGDFDRAIANYERSRAMFHALGDRRSLAVVALNLANAARDRGDLEHAEAVYRDALHHSQAVGDERVVAASLAGLGGVAHDRERSRDAAVLLGAAAAQMDPASLDEAPRYEADVADLKASMGEEPFAVAWETGRALPLDAAILETGVLASAVGSVHTFGVGGEPAATSPGSNAGDDRFRPLHQRQGAAGTGAFGH